MKNIMALDAIAIAKQILVEEFREDFVEGEREHIVRDALRRAARVMWGSAANHKRDVLVDNFMTLFETFLGANSGFGIPPGFILLSRFAHLITTTEDAIALLDLFGDYTYRHKFEVVGSNEWKQLKHGHWFEIAV